MYLQCNYGKPTVEEGNNGVACPKSNNTIWQVGLSFQKTNLKNILADFACGMGGLGG